LVLHLRWRRADGLHHDAPSRRRRGGLVFVAVDDISTTVKRATELGGGTGEQTTRVHPDVGDYAVLIDPDGTRIGVFHSFLRSHRSRPDLPGTTQRNGI